ncbi:hypothetical protein MSG28_004234, partial [Choristoneura fumiferana]
QKSPLSEYLFLPWLGMTLRGLILRQVPTVTALIYTMSIVEGSVNPLFLTAFIFLFFDYLFHGVDSAYPRASWQFPTDGVSWFDGYSRHLFATKHWFSRISSSNKKIFILALLKHLNSAWAISLLLKAIWNCRPKDAVSSVCEVRRNQHHVVDLLRQELTLMLNKTLKLEELEMTFTDGTKKKIWKVNRPIPEVIETVDFLQLLPSAIGKRILSFLPNTFLVDCARVNKYWAYLVDDLKAEAAARLKIDADMEKLKDLVLRHDTSMNTMDGTEQTFAINSQMASTAPSMMYERPSLRPNNSTNSEYG